MSNKKLKISEIKQIVENTKVESILLVTKIAKELTSTNKEYLTITLQDDTGEISAKVWSMEFYRRVKVGQVCQLTLGVKEYNGSMTYDVKEFMVDFTQNPDNFKNSFTPRKEEMKKYLKSVLSDIMNRRDDLKVIIQSVFKIDGFDSFFDMPAALKMHHDKENELLYHTVAIMHHADALIGSTKQMYDVDIDRDLIMTAVFIHDFFKIKEYKYNEVNSLEATEYLAMLGHIAMCSEFIGYLKYSKQLNEETAKQINHILLAHHGKQEYGSPVSPATIEAHIVSTLDGFDAKLYAFVKNYKELPVGTHSKQKDYSIGNSVYHPKKLFADYVEPVRSETTESPNKQEFSDEIKNKYGELNMEDIEGLSEMF